MTTIQERLREPAYIKHAMGRPTFAEDENAATMSEAAARIDALEAALREIRDKRHVNGKKMLDHIAEVEYIARAALGEGE